MELLSVEMGTRISGTRTCVACGASEMCPLADLGPVPVLSGVTFDEREEALRSPAGRMELLYCPSCCHVYNSAFDESLIDYGVDYDNTLHYSRTFQAYATDLAGRLAREYDLEGKHVVELGCGKGHFLIELCRTAGCTGTGFDPSYAGDVQDGAVTFMREHMSWDDHPGFDFFVSRHVLEHLPEPYDFLIGLRHACGSRPVRGYVEVPDAIYDFERSPWNCHYPHVSYFSATSLARLGMRAGFGLLRLVRSFEGQYLSLELGVNVPTPDEVMFTGMGLHREREVLTTFHDNHDAIVKAWETRIDTIGYDHCALWGAGAKGLGFLNAIDPDGRLAAVVDLNPRKHGKFLPVTGHRIRGPDELRGRDIQTVIITNPAYRREIEAALKDLGVSATVTSAH
jgi:SAM-dependent methyltransferase